MTEDYYLDLEKYSLDRFQYELEHIDLLPGRKILQEKIKERMQILRDNGIDNLDKLQENIKTTPKAKKFAETTGLPEEYVKILRREVNSLKPPPIPLNKFPGIKPETVEKLGRIGIKNTYKYFQKVKNSNDRKELAYQADLNEEEVLLLTKLTDLARVKWIGPITAWMIIESGVQNVEELKDSDPKTLYQNMIKINQEKEYTRARFVENDMKLCIDFARDVPLVIKY
jgi:hypothetical protein